MESLKRQVARDRRDAAREDRVTLVLVGKGPDEQALRDQVERLGLQQRVRFEIDVTDAACTSCTKRHSPSTTVPSTRTTAT
jgi:glycosyltransferase involved in cell wall biosynthesis